MNDNIGYVKVSSIFVYMKTLAYLCNEGNYNNTICPCKV